MVRFKLFVFLLPLLCTAVFAQDTSSVVIDTSIYDSKSVEQLPEYPGGMNNFYKYLQSNYKYPRAAIENGIGGRVLLTFVVEKNGVLSEFDVLENPGYGTAEELVRILKGCSVWKPGMQGGRPVRVMYTLPFIISSRKKVPPERDPFGWKKRQ